MVVFESGDELEDVSEVFSLSDELSVLGEDGCSLSQKDGKLVSEGDSGELHCAGEVLLSVVEVVPLAVR